MQDIISVSYSNVLDLILLTSVEGILLQVSSGASTDLRQELST